MDLVLCRYKDIDYIMELEANMGGNLIREAVRLRERDELYETYMAQVPFILMSLLSDKSISFDEFYKRSARMSKNKTVAKVYDKEETMKNVENIINSLNSGGEIN